jgi:hypothetical protein
VCGMETAALAPQPPTFVLLRSGHLLLDVLDLVEDPHGGKGVWKSAVIRMLLFERGVALAIVWQ